MTGHSLATIKPGYLGGISAGVPRQETSRGYRSRCECGWVSGYYLGHDAARRAWLDHMTTLSYGRS